MLILRCPIHNLNLVITYWPCSANELITILILNFKKHEESMNILNVFGPAVKPNLKTLDLAIKLNIGFSYKTRFNSIWILATELVKILKG